MKSLLLLRHAKSSWKHPGLADHDRPLKKRGRRDASRMGRLLVTEELIPEMILASSAVRARETAAAVASACGESASIRSSPELYSAGPGDYALLLRGLPDARDRVLLVGHNPTLEELLELLTGARETLPTAALALVELPIGSWGELALDGSALLVRVWRPRELE